MIEGFFESPVVLMIDRPVSGFSIASPQPVTVHLYRYFLAGPLLHAISAALYEGDSLILKTRPIHCHTLTEQGLQFHLQTMLEALSQKSGVTLYSFDQVSDLLLGERSCPVMGCHLNPAFRLEEIL